jgi:hypothetical protein
VSPTRVLPIAVLFTLLSVLMQLWLTQQSPLTPALAPPTAFSGERAMRLLEEFLAENAPHPVGSAANRRVKQRIQAWLDTQGIAHEEQAVWACSSDAPSCSYVENIIATLPGSEPGPYIALMAHYDSVPPAAGAGDDMAGVVAVLEAARAAKATGGFRHPILLLITDGEETGLHGAEGFFQRHPLADEIAVLLNVEGSGTRGVSRVLRTSGPNGWFMDRFRDAAAQRSGTSLANEVFKRMPNDTDFSVSMAAEIPGIDFAFAAERNHYHTPNDSLANLDPRTIQHHGDNIFPLVLRLANADLGTEGEARAVYFDAYGFWFQWAEGMSSLLLAVAGLSLLAASWRIGATPLAWLSASILVPLAVLIGAGVLVHGCFYVLERLNGTLVPWPAYLWPFRVVVYAASLLPAVLIGRWLAPRFGLFLLLGGGAWFLFILTAVLVWLLPDTAVPFLVTLLPLCTILALSVWLPLSRRGQELLVAASVVSTSLLLGAALVLEQTQGFALFFAIWPWVGLFAVLSIGFVRAWGSRLLVGATGLALLTGMGAASVLPLYSEYRPQHLNIWYLQEEGSREAMLYLWPFGPLPSTVQASASFEADALGGLPWSEGEFEYLAPAESNLLAAPTLTVVDEAFVVFVDEQRVGAERKLRLRFASQRAAGQLRLYLPGSAGAWRAELDGIPLERRARRDDQGLGYERIVIHGVQNRSAELVLWLPGDEPVEAWVADLASALPAVAQEVRAARPTIAVPVHTGDASLVYRRVVL